MEKPDSKAYQDPSFDIRPSCAVFFPYQDREGSTHLLIEEGH